MHSIVYILVKGVIYLLHRFDQYNAVQTQFFPLCRKFVTDHR